MKTEKPHPPSLKLRRTDCSLIRPRRGLCGLGVAYKLNSLNPFFTAKDAEFRRGLKAILNHLSTLISTNQNTKNSENFDLDRNQSDEKNDLHKRVCESRLLHRFGFVPAAGRISTVLNAFSEFKTSVSIRVHQRLIPAFPLCSFLSAIVPQCGTKEDAPSAVKSAFSPSPLLGYRANLLLSFSLALFVFRRSAIALATVGFLAVNPAFSALVFDSSTVEIPPNPSLTEWIADYPFKNSGTKTVTITNIRTCCDCTSSKLEKKTYAPHETGKLSLLFKLEGKSGLQEKHAVITTDDGAQPQVIFLKGKIPSVYDSITLSTQSLRWELGEARKPKSVTIKLLDPTAVKILAATTSTPDFQLQLQLNPKGDSTLLITPPKASIKQTAKAMIQTDFPRKSDSTLEITLGAF